MSIEKPRSGKEQSAPAPVRQERPPETTVRETPAERDAKRQEQLEELHRRIQERRADNPEGIESSESLRRVHKRYENPGPAHLEAAEKERIAQVAQEERTRLEENYESGFGVFPTSDPRENFYNQVWTRDLAHAGGNYFAEEHPQALADSLETIISHQREDGSLPLRVEKEYLLMKLVPGLRALAGPAFDLFERKLRGRDERAVYEGESFSSAEDTVPTTLVAAGEFFIASDQGRRFVTDHFNQLERAADYFRTKVDPQDSLFSAKYKNADWADSINRGGKLGGINIWWTRSLRLMSFMAGQLGEKENAALYREEFRKVKQSVMEKLYDRNGAFFRAEEGSDRVDTVASIFGSLYLLDAQECVRVQETLKERASTASGLKNFDPPYPSKQVMLPHKLIRHGGYHNSYVWPWVTCQNIQAKIKIALEHPDEDTRMQYKQEAVDDLVDMTDLFTEAGGAYEIFSPDTREPILRDPLRMRLYPPPKNLMANLAAYEGAYLQLKKLDWI